MARRIEHILCPSDFSGHARSALAHAAVVGARLRGRVTLLHVVPRLGAHPVRGSLALAQARLPAERSLLDERLERFAEPARLSGVRVDTALCEGETVEEILEQARALGADLIVMGTRGARAAGGWRLGSVTARVIGRSACPVLAVPDGTSLGRRIGDVRRVLCPIDFSEPGGLALEYARMLARAFRARLLLLHVLEWFPGDSSMLDSLCVGEFQLDVVSEARARMSALALAEACEHEELVATGLPHRRILELAREREVDLIVLGIHGRRAIDRLLPGGTVCHVFREAPCPVLAVSPPPAGERESREFWW